MAQMNLIVNFEHDKSKSAIFQFEDTVTLDKVRTEAALASKDYFVVGELKIATKSESKIVLNSLDLTNNTLHVSNESFVKEDVQDVVVSKSGADPIIMHMNVLDALSSLKAQLLDKNYMTEADSFEYKGASLSDASLQNPIKNYLVEGKIEVWRAINTQKVKVVKGEKSKTFSFDVNKPLVEFKKLLVEDGFISDSDRFTHDGSTLNESSMNDPVKMFLESGSIKIKHEESKWKWDTKDPALVSPAEVDLKTKLEYQKTQLDAPFPAEGKVVTDGEKDHFDKLSPEQQQHLIMRNNLFSGYVVNGFGEEPSSFPLFLVDQEDVFYKLPTVSVRVDKHASFNRIEHERMKSGSKKSSGGLNLGFFAIKNETEESSKEQEISKSEVLLTYVGYKIPKIVIEFDPRSLVLRKSFIREFMEIQYFGDFDDNVSENKLHRARVAAFDSVNQILDKYGHIIYTKFTLGGALYSTSEKEKSDEQSYSEELTKHEIGFSSKVQYNNMTAQGDFSTGNASGESSLDKNLQEYMNLAINCIGGNENTYTESNTWIASLGPYMSWRVIDKDKAVPTLSLLPETLKQKVRALFAEMKDNTDELPFRVKI